MTSWHPLPHAVYSFVESTPGTVLLHSSRPGECTFSRLFTAPLQIIEIRELADLPALFSTIEQAAEYGRFAAGFFAYECAQYFEPTVSVVPPLGSDLLAWFGIYERCHTFDHHTGAFDPDLQVDPLLEDRWGSDISIPAPDINFGLNEQQFASRVDKIHNWIREGDVYQLNFTFPLHAQFAEPPASLYARLAQAQPVDYGAFLHADPGRHILSFSPELFFCIDQNRRITSQPMKGTAPRGRTNQEDESIAQWLAQDEKNRAENVMIVDLIRNDLGRVCSFGSVAVENLFQVERYPSLWQMTSSISGDLRPGVSYEEIFRALFPCGSITGAPKVRSMQLLAELEEKPRGVYTGSIGFFSREQTIFNVAIRTLELEHGNARGGVGGGILIDSKAEDEYRECQLKADFLRRSCEPFSLIETLLWDGEFKLLEFHLDRLADSARYFGFVYTRDLIRRTFLAEASHFSGSQPRKVRLLLHGNGETHLETELLPAHSNNPAPLRVCIAPSRTDPSDPFLFHKTTRRDLYNSSYTAARSAGFADTLFFNTREELTEGAVHSVFIEKCGRWSTPSLDCGVLPGVYRRHLLTTRPGTEEKVLTMNDLKAADRVYICNAVRGLRQVTIDFDHHIGF